MSTLAQKFITKARELVPFQNELQDLDPSINCETAIDELMFRKGEYLGGMAVVILELVKEK